MFDARTEAGETPLHWSALAGPLLEIRIYGDDRDHADTPEKLVARAIVARLLIDKGANVNAPDNSGATPLHYAALFANRPVVEFLVAGGARVDKKESDGAVPLDFATRNLEGLPGISEELPGSWESVWEWMRAYQEMGVILRYASEPAPSGGAANSGATPLA